MGRDFFYKVSPRGSGAGRGWGGGATKKKWSRKTLKIDYKYNTSSRSSWYYSTVNQGERGPRTTPPITFLYFPNLKTSEIVVPLLWCSGLAPTERNSHRKRFSSGTFLNLDCSEVRAHSRARPFRKCVESSDRSKESGSRSNFERFEAKGARASPFLRYFVFSSFRYFVLFFFFFLFCTVVVLASRKEKEKRTVYFFICLRIVPLSVL